MIDHYTVCMKETLCTPHLQMIQEKIQFIIIMENLYFGMQACDIFALPIALNFEEGKQKSRKKVPEVRRDKVGYSTKTAFGGFMTVLMIAGLTGYLVTRIHTIYTTREYDYRKRDVTYTDQQMDEMAVTFGKFNNSLNPIIGLQGLQADFDILNNPYVKFIGYKNYMENSIITLEESYELELCSLDQ